MKVIGGLVRDMSSLGFHAYVVALWNVCFFLKFRLRMLDSSIGNLWDYICLVEDGLCNHMCRVNVVS